ncbi:MAG: hypothetical protein Q9167_003441 [Letrouitia subvulpina]
MGPEMDPHLGNPRQIHDPMLDGHLRHLSRDYDTSLLRKEKDQYEGYSFEKLEAEHPHQKATWALARRTKMPLPQTDLLAQVNKQKRKGNLARDLLFSSEMYGFKRRQVEQLISDRTQADPRFNYDLVGLKLDQSRHSRGRITTAFQVILKRRIKSDLTNVVSPPSNKLHEPMSEIIDLTGGSDSRSEGSIQDYFGSVPSGPHFPHHENRSFEHQPGPFVRGLSPGIHHGPSPVPHGFPPIHHGGPPPHHDALPPHHGGLPMDHSLPMDDLFMHQGHQQNMPPPQPIFHDQPDLPRSKPVKMGEPHKSSPKLHQGKPQKSHHKHGRSSSDTESDSASDISGFSRTDTARTPDTAYSSYSSNKGKKYHEGHKHHRSSRNPHDDEDVYRVHRRKPARSPDRSPRRDHGRYEIEEVAILPASSSRKNHPYLSRSRTIDYHHERPTSLHHRALSYDDERPQGLRGLAPNRRSSVYAPSRILEVDLFDERAERARFEKDEMKREIIREEVEKDRQREEVQREVRKEIAAVKSLEKEADARRRHERGLAGERLYEDRPGRYSRGYDNDRFYW